MSYTNVISLLGGLALFLYGMNALSSSLERRAGNQLKTILGKLTSSKSKGFLLGLVVTAIIQSSSATTVMVVGFVNSGIMKLGQAVNVIIGANVGTAVTSWILSLTGIQGDVWYLTLLKPATFTPILALVGIILVMFCKSDSKKNNGEIMLGFAVLMYGMEAMSGAVKPLADVPEFANLFMMFSNPILGVLMGALLTAVIQSSSASVGILQALSVTGSVTFASAVPIIMGQNIGTCVTAMISSVGATREAKRAAMIHLYFNVIGTAVWLIVIYSINAIFPLPFFGYPADAIGIAVVHTIFKLLCTAMFLPFSKQLERLACWTIRDKSGDEQVQLLDERLFVTPAVAIESSRTATIEMARLSVNAIENAFALLNQFDSKQMQLVISQEDQADVYEDKLGTYLVKLSSRPMSEQDSREATKLLHIIGDYERISDHAVNIAESAKEMNEKGIAFSGAAQQELSVIIGAVKEIMSLSMKAFSENDLRAAAYVEPLEQVVDDLKIDIKKRHVLRLQHGECTIENGFVLTDLLTNLERVSDHCSNIAISVIDTVRDSFDAHGYLSDLKTNDAAFANEYRNYREKYSINQITAVKNPIA